MGLVRNADYCRGRTTRACREDESDSTAKSLQRRLLQLKRSGADAGSRSCSCPGKVMRRIDAAQALKKRTGMGQAGCRGLERSPGAADAR
jgi:hypothetical protein